VARLPVVGSLRIDRLCAQIFETARTKRLIAVAKPLLGFVVSNFRKLEVWRKAHALVLNVHSSAKRIRGSDYLSLRSQMVRAAMSVPTNLVEGTGQQTAREFGRFIRIALNSASELEYHLLVAKDFGVMKESEFASLSSQTVQVRKMLYGLLSSVAVNSPSTKKNGSHRS
jgi:four helix bundle protein